MGSRYGRSHIWVFNCVMLLLRGTFTRISIYIFFIIHLLIHSHSSSLALTIDNAINIIIIPQKKISYQFHHHPRSCSPHLSPKCHLQFETDQQRCCSHSSFLVPGPTVFVTSAFGMLGNIIEMVEPGWRGIVVKHLCLYTYMLNENRWFRCVRIVRNQPQNMKPSKHLKPDIQR